VSDKINPLTGRPCKDKKAEKKKERRYGPPRPIPRPRPRPRPPRASVVYV
jgi:hypothetical protein